MIYIYNVSELASGVDVCKLSLEFQDVKISVNSISLSDDGQECYIESGVSRDTLTPIVLAHEGPASLASHKCKKYTSIDARTTELIEQGFQYVNKTFSLSQTAQAKMMGVHQVRDDPMLTYPVKWNTIDDNDYYDIVDSDELHLFYMSGVGTYKAFVDSGTAIKDLVRAATSKAEVDTIVDDR